MDQNTYDSTFHDPAKKLDDAASKVSDAAKSSADALSDRAQQGFDRAGETLRSVADGVSTQARTISSMAQDRVATVGEAMEATIHERPMLAVMTAVALGYAVAFLIHRK